MENKAISIMLIFLIIGIVFFGKGMTGFVVSESCCFQPNCDAENLCNTARLESPKKVESSSRDTFVGGFFISAAIGIYLALRMKREREAEWT